MSALQRKARLLSPSARLLPPALTNLRASLLLSSVLICCVLSSISEGKTGLDVHSDAMQIYSDYSKLVEGERTRVIRSPFRPPMVAGRKRSLKNSTEKPQVLTIPISQKASSIGSPFSRPRNEPRNQTSDVIDRETKEKIKTRVSPATSFIRPPFVVHKKKPSKKLKPRKKAIFQPILFHPQNDQTQRESDKPTNSKFGKKYVSTSERDHQKSEQENLSENTSHLHYKNDLGNKTAFKLLESSYNKLLSDLPLTEIVHDITLEPKQKYDSPFDFDNAKNSKYEDKEYFKNNFRFKNKKSKDYFYENKRYKSNHPKLRESDIKSPSSGFGYRSFHAERESPMVVSFQPPKTKTIRENEPAAISSISLQIKRPPPLLHARKDLANTIEPSSTLSPFRDDIHSSKLRLVFPVRGILMFCGILGAFAIITIVILIIYGATKCNRTPKQSSTFALTESQDLSSLSSSSMKSIEEQI